MRALLRGAIAAGSITLAGFVFSSPAVAQSTPGLWDHGLFHQPLGEATLGYDPLGKLVVSNIGSSGNDGVAITVPDGCEGVSFLWEDQGDLARHRLDLQERAVAGNATFGYAQIDAASGGFDVRADFSGAEAVSYWAEVMDGDVVVGRVLMSNLENIHISPMGPAAPVISKVGAKTNGPTSHYLWVQLSGPFKFTTQSGDLVGRALFMHCCVGRHMKREAIVTFKGQAGGGGGPGGFAIQEQGVKIAGGAFHIDPSHEIRDFDAHSIGPAAHFTTFDGKYFDMQQVGEAAVHGVEFSPGVPTTNLDEVSLRIKTFTWTQTSGPPAFVALDAAGSGGSSRGGISITINGTNFEMQPDYSSVGSATHRARVYDGTALIADLPLRTGSIEMPADSFQVMTRRAPAAEPRAAGFLILCITEPCPKFLIDGAMYSGDRLEVTADGLPPGPAGDQTLSSLRVTGRADDLVFLDVQMFATAQVAGVPVPAPRTDFEIRRIAPNPSAGITSAELTLERATTLRAEILDLAGRRVRFLARDAFEAGIHRLAWDGREDSGNLSPAGVYFIRIESAGIARSARFARLR